MKREDNQLAHFVTRMAVLSTYFDVEVEEQQLDVDDVFQNNFIHQ